jgi:hypothetical protein
METVYRLEPTWTRAHVEDVWRLQLRDPESADYMIKLMQAVWIDYLGYWNGGTARLHG